MCGGSWSECLSATVSLSSLLQELKLLSWWRREKRVRLLGWRETSTSTTSASFLVTTTVTALLSWSPSSGRFSSPLLSSSSSPSFLHYLPSALLTLHKHV
jgi:hypothetical protein